MRWTLIVCFCLLLSCFGYGQFKVGIKLGPGYGYYEHEELDYLYSKGFYTVGADVKYGKKLMIGMNVSYMMEVFFIKDSYRVSYDYHYARSELNIYKNYLSLSLYPELFLQHIGYIKLGANVEFVLSVKEKGMIYHRIESPHPYPQKYTENISNDITHGFFSIIYNVFWGLGFPVTLRNNYQANVECNLNYGLRRINSIYDDYMGIRNVFGIQLLLGVQYNFTK